MDDMVPGLLKSMSDDFQSQYDSNEKIQSLNEKLNNGTATYKEANEYASEVGSITESTYETYLTSENLPDGKCYYNIASRVTSTTLHNQYELVADYTEEVQTTLNQKAGIGLKAQRADEDTSSYKSLADYMSAADNYDDVAKSTAQSAARMAMSTVDNSVKKNTEFQGKSGLSPKIIRNGGSGCCEWCSGLSGTYDYPKVPSDVYARHNNCTCTVEYDPGSGKRQDVWTKEWTSEEEAAEKENLKTLGLDNENNTKKIEYRKNIGNSAVSNTQTKVQTGGKITGGHHYPNDKVGGIKAKKAAELYEKFSRVDDSAVIAQNTGFSEKDIQTIRSHVFYEKHDLYDGYNRFSPDYDMAVAWKRLQDGDYLPRDITLLNHELLESKFEKEYNLSAEEAHDLAQNIYNWAKQLLDETDGKGEPDGIL